MTKIRQCEQVHRPVLKTVSPFIIIFKLIEWKYHYCSKRNRLYSTNINIELHIQDWSEIPCFISKPVIYPLKSNLNEVSKVVLKNI